MRALWVAALVSLSLLGACSGPPAEEGLADAGPPADLSLKKTAKTCPPEMALLSYGGVHICMDRYEAAVVRVLPDGHEESWPFNRPVDGLPVRAIVRPGIKPQAYISAAQASAACLRAGKRLCTEKEWLAACQGPDGYTFPYGRMYTQGACNEGRAKSPVHDCFGNDDSVFTYEHMNDPCCDDQPNTVTPGGAFPTCQSTAGIYDLHGNLHEWVDAMGGPGKGVLKGGFFVDAWLGGPGCLYRTAAHAKNYHDYSTGFRCCAAPRTP